jgi:hypothetical protein
MRWESFGYSSVMFLILLHAVPCLGQSDEELPRLGVQGKVSTLGVGVEAATAVTSRSNVRFGFHAFSLSLDRSRDGIEYDGTLRLRSANAVFDYYIYRGFHAGGGVLLYNGNKLDANASVPGGRTFTLGGTRLVSDPVNPVTGIAKLAVNKAAPMILFGIGNPLPRDGRRFTVNFDFGVVFHGSPGANLSLTGNACDTAIRNCVDAGTNPIIRDLVQAEQADWIHDLEPFKFYPVVSIGFGYRF